MAGKLALSLQDSVSLTTVKGEKVTGKVQALDEVTNTLVLKLPGTCHLTHPPTHPPNPPSLPNQ